MNGGLSLLDKAKQDLVALKYIGLDDEFVFDIYAYHLQQAFEKMMKHVLYLNALPVPFTHDIDELWSRLPPHMQNYFDLSEEAREKLTSYEAKSRYRGNNLYTRSILERYLFKAEESYERLRNLPNTQYTSLFS